MRGPWVSDAGAVPATSSTAIAPAPSVSNASAPERPCRYARTRPRGPIVASIGTTKRPSNAPLAVETSPWYIGPAWYW